jgi:type II secretory pathway component GspD/PulD (secretin)
MAQMLTVLSFTVLSLSPSSLAEALIEVEWKEGQLSVNAEKAPLAHILREITRQTGLQVETTEKLQKLVSVHSSRVSLIKGLQDLLAGMDYVIIGDASRQVQPIRLMIFEGSPIRNHERTELSAYSTPSTETRSEPTLDEPIPEEVMDTNGGTPASEDGQATKLLQISASSSHQDTQDLRKAVQDPNPLIRSKAFEALASLDSAEAVDALLNVAKSDQPNLRLHALQLLAQTNDADEGTVLSLLQEALKDTDRMIQGYAIHALAKRGGSVASTFLREALRDPDPSVRAIVIENLSQKQEGRLLLQEAPSPATTVTRQDSSERN